MTGHAFSFGAFAVALLLSSAALAQTQAPAPPAGSAAPSVGESINRIEGRLIDLQVQLATLSSLGEGANSQRISSITGEMQALAREFREKSGRRASIQPEQTSALQLGSAGAVTLTAPETPSAAGGGWGATTITPGTDVAPVERGELNRDDVFGSQAPQPGPFAALPADRSNESRSGSLTGPEQEYQTAYSYLLQQDYGAAETAFRDFVKRHPKSPLAGNAQYWLGETHYVRGAYRPAAVAFLKGFETYGDGGKGPDSLLKLGMALARLNQKDAACSSLGEVKRRYPSAAQNVLSRARSEADRLKCSR